MECKDRTDLGKPIMIVLMDRTKVYELNSLPRKLKKKIKKIGVPVTAPKRVKLTWEKKKV
jgi:hypothetical protein